MSATPASAPPAAASPPPRSSPPAEAPAGRAGFGRGFAVLAGWYATVATALALWISGLPSTSLTDDDCSGFACGWSAQDVAVLALIVAGPQVVLVGGGAALVTLLLTGRWLRSAVVTGTLAALVGMVGTPAVLALGWAVLS